MSEPVTGFPFNVTDNPMYDGSTLLFIGNSIVGKVSPAGLLLTALVFVTYKVACRFEEPFTAMIYEEKEKNEKNEKNIGE